MPRIRRRAPRLTTTERGLFAFVLTPQDQTAETAEGLLEIFKARGVQLLTLWQITEEAIDVWRLYGSAPTRVMRPVILARLDAKLHARQALRQAIQRAGSVDLSLGPMREALRALEAEADGDAELRKFVARNWAGGKGRPRSWRTLFVRRLQGGLGRDDARSWRDVVEARLRSEPAASPPRISKRSLIVGTMPHSEEKFLLIKGRN